MSGGPDFGLLRPLYENPAYDPTKMGGIPNPKSTGQAVAEGVGGLMGKMKGMAGGAGGGGGGGGMRRGGKAKKGISRPMGEQSGVPPKQQQQGQQQQQGGGLGGLPGLLASLFGGGQQGCGPNGCGGQLCSDGSCQVCAGGNCGPGMQQGQQAPQGMMGGGGRNCVGGEGAGIPEFDPGAMPSGAIGNIGMNGQGVPFDYSGAMAQRAIGGPIGGGQAFQGGEHQNSNPYNPALAGGGGQGGGGGDPSGQAASMMSPAGMVGMEMADDAHCPDVGGNVAGAVKMWGAALGGDVRQNQPTMMGEPQAGPTQGQQPQSQPQMGQQGAPTKLGGQGSVGSLPMGIGRQQQPGGSGMDQGYSAMPGSFDTTTPSMAGNQLNYFDISQLAGGRAFGGPMDEQNPYMTGESLSGGGAPETRPEIVVPGQGQPYMVGQNGPEVVTPPEDSFVIPNPKTIQEDPVAAQHAAQGFQELSKRMPPSQGQQGGGQQPMGNSAATEALRRNLPAISARSQRGPGNPATDQYGVTGSPNQQGMPFTGASAYGALGGPKSPLNPQMGLPQITQSAGAAGGGAGAPGMVNGINAQALKNNTGNYSGHVDPYLGVSSSPAESQAIQNSMGYTPGSAGSPSAGGMQPGQPSYAGQSADRGLPQLSGYGAGNQQTSNMMSGMAGQGGGMAALQGMMGQGAQGAVPQMRPSMPMGSMGGGNLMPQSPPQMPSGSMMNQYHPSPSPVGNPGQYSPDLSNSKPNALGGPFQGYTSPNSSLPRNGNDNNANYTQQMDQGQSQAKISPELGNVGSGTEMNKPRMNQNVAKNPHEELSNAINKAPLDMFGQLRQRAPQAAPLIANRGIQIRKSLAGKADLSSASPEDMAKYATKQVQLAGLFSPMGQMSPQDRAAAYAQIYPKVKEIDPKAPNKYDPAYHVANMSMAAPLLKLQAARLAAQQGGGAGQMMGQGQQGQQAAQGMQGPQSFGQQGGQLQGMQSAMQGMGNQAGGMAQSAGQGSQMMSPGQGAQQGMQDIQSFGQSPDVPRMTGQHSENDQQIPEQQHQGGMSSNFYNKVGKVEGTGKNPTSSASGPYQFINSTFGQYLKDKDPGMFKKFSSLSGSQQTQFKTQYMQKNPSGAMDWLVEKNQSALTKAGVPINDATMYGAHFLGSGGLIKAWNAGDKTPVSQVVPHSVIAANKSILGGNKTVGDFKNWLTKKMADKGQPSGSEMAQRATGNKNAVPVGLDLTKGYPNNMKQLQGSNNPNQPKGVWDVSDRATDPQEQMWREKNDPHWKAAGAEADKYDSLVTSRFPGRHYNNNYFGGGYGMDYPSPQENHWGSLKASNPFLAAELGRKGMIEHWLSGNSKAEDMNRIDMPHNKASVSGRGDIDLSKFNGQGPQPYTDPQTGRSYMGINNIGNSGDMSISNPGSGARFSQGGTDITAAPRPGLGGPGDNYLSSKQYPGAGYKQGQPFGGMGQGQQGQGGPYDQSQVPPGYRNAGTSPSGMATPVPYADNPGEEEWGDQGPGGSGKMQYDPSLQTPENPMTAMNAQGGSGGMPGTMSNTIQNQPHTPWAQHDAMMNGVRSDIAQHPQNYDTNKMYKTAQNQAGREEDAQMQQQMSAQHPTILPDQYISQLQQLAQQRPELANQINQIISNNAQLKQGGDQMNAAQGSVPTPHQFDGGAYAKANQPTPDQFIPGGKGQPDTMIPGHDPNRISIANSPEVRREMPPNVDSAADKTKDNAPVKIGNGMYELKDGKYVEMPRIGSDGKQLPPDYKTDARKGTQQGTSNPETGRTGLTIPVATQIQKETLDLQEQMMRMSQSDAYYKPEFSTYQARAKALALEKMDKAKMAPQDTQWLQQYSGWKASVSQNANQILKTLSGTAVSDQEFVRVMTNLPNATLSPAQYQAINQQYQMILKTKWELNNDIMKNGMPNQEALDAKFKPMMENIKRIYYQNKPSPGNAQGQQAEQGQGQQKLAGGGQYSQSDLEYTAKKHGMTVEQVKAKLGGR